MVAQSLDARVQHLAWPRRRAPHREGGSEHQACGGGGLIGPLLSTVHTLATATALFAVIVVASSDVVPDKPLAMSAPETVTTDGGSDRRTMARDTGGEWAAGAYGGVSYTHPSTVVIKNGNRTDVTVSGFDWVGKPFKAPIYYGARIQRWFSGRVGAMVDFIHAKAIARDEDTATYTGQHNGTPLPETATIEDVFRKLEFSHGHNMLTLNGLLRLAPSWMRLRPYIGVGGGVSLPHTEVGFRADNTRTYEYQFTGFAGQALAGLEIQLGRASVFLEYKFTYAPYNVPLTQRSSKDFLVTDVWYQIRDWFAGKAPEGGRLDT
ncbi:MAG: hypothetical protein AAGG99_07960, partial [Pseudomonadota bacterium]